MATKRREYTMFSAHTLAATNALNGIINHATDIGLMSKREKDLTIAALTVIEAVMLPRMTVLSMEEALIEFGRTAREIGFGQ